MNTKLKYEALRNLYLDLINTNIDLKTRLQQRDRMLYKAFYITIPAILKGHLDCMDYDYRLVNKWYLKISYKLNQRTGDLFQHNKF